MGWWGGVFVRLKVTHFIKTPVNDGVVCLLSEVVSAPDGSRQEIIVKHKIFNKRRGRGNVRLEASLLAGALSPVNHNNGRQ